MVADETARPSNQHARPSCHGPRRAVGIVATTAGAGFTWIRIGVSKKTTAPIVACLVASMVRLLRHDFRVEPLELVCQGAPGQLGLSQGSRTAARHLAAVGIAEGSLEGSRKSLRRRF